MSTAVTPHFTVEEFHCHDGTPYPVEWIDDRLRPLCETLEVIREAAGGASLRIDSGYRSLAYDDRLYKAHVVAIGDDGKVAPASRSQHPQGRAADVVHATHSPPELFALVLQLFADGKLPHLGGVGKYPSFVHVDVRPRSGDHLAVWGGARPSNIA